MELVVFAEQTAILLAQWVRLILRHDQAVRLFVQLSLEGVNPLIRVAKVRYKTFY